MALFRYFSYYIPMLYRQSPGMSDRLCAARYAYLTQIHANRISMKDQHSACHWHVHR